MLNNKELMYYTEIFGALDIDRLAIDEQMCIVMAQANMLKTIKPILDKYEYLLHENETKNLGDGAIYNFVYRKKTDL